MNKPLTRWAGVLAEWAGEILYGRELARIRWHQAGIDRLRAEVTAPGELAGLTADPEARR